MAYTRNLGQDAPSSNRQTDGRTDGRTHRPTDRQTEKRTDTNNTHIGICLCGFVKSFHFHLSSLIFSCLPSSSLYCNAGSTVCFPNQQHQTVAATPLMDLLPTLHVTNGHVCYALPCSNVWPQCKQQLFKGIFGMACRYTGMISPCLPSDSQIP